eukprot:5704452-Prymnesium_polylepis.7
MVDPDSDSDSSEVPDSKGEHRPPGSGDLSDIDDDSNGSQQSPDNGVTDQNPDPCSTNDQADEDLEHFRHVKASTYLKTGSYDTLALLVRTLPMLKQFDLRFDERIKKTVRRRRDEELWDEFSRRELKELSGQLLRRLKDAAEKKELSEDGAHNSKIDSVQVKGVPEEVCNMLVDEWDEDRRGECQLHYENWRLCNDHVLARLSITSNGGLQMETRQVKATDHFLKNMQMSVSSHEIAEAFNNPYDNLGGLERRKES